MTKLPLALQEWRTPRHPEFREGGKTAWCAATMPAPVPLTDEIARLVATIRLGVGATEGPAPLPTTRSEEGAMKTDDEPGISPANAETRRTPVGPELADAIRRMDDLLQAEFGFDLAYCILARGAVVAASNSRDGYLPPTVAPLGGGA